MTWLTKEPVLAGAILQAVVMVALAFLHLTDAQVSAIAGAQALVLGALVRNQVSPK